MESQLNRHIHIYSSESKQLLEAVLSLGVFIISPVLSLPILLIGAYNQKGYSYILISFFLGLISMYYYPQGDQFRYLEDFKVYSDTPLNELFDFNSLLTYRNLNLITISLFSASKVSWFTLELYRFFIVSLASWICIITFNKLMKIYFPDITKSLRFKLFLLIILSIPVYYVSQGFRSGLGAVFICLGCVDLIEKKKYGYIWFLVASFIHYSYLPISLLFIIGLNSKVRITNKNFLLFLFGILLCVIILVYLLYSSVPFITMILNIYVFGSYGSDFVWNAYRIKEIVLINGLPTIIMYWLFIKSKKDMLSFKFSNIMYINLILVILSLPFQAFTQRLGIISVLLLSYYSVSYYKSMKLRKYYQIIFLSLLVSVIYPFFMHRYCYKYAHFENFFVSPLPVILENSYSIQDAYILLDRDGILKDQYLK